MNKARLLSPVFASVALPVLVLACGGGGQSSTAQQPTSTTATPAPTAPAAQKVSDTPEPADTEGKIKWALAGNQRTDKEKARDQYRHPLETLEFFGLKDDQTVVELWPGGGWYTEILAPVLHDKGKLVVTTFDAKAEHAQEYNDKLAASPEIYGKVTPVLLNPPSSLALGPDNSADLVVTFRNFHNWMDQKMASKVVNAAFKVLKPGGVFGIEEHRGAPGADPMKSAKQGYVPEDVVIQIVETEGFKLDKKSEINANAKDTKDYDKGVWALPPVYRNGDKDHAKYEAIGESDRMTLRFVKPLK
ncbi:MAG: methyltransferase domain-containing protein [Polyangiaceae bacterium]